MHPVRVSLPIRCRAPTVPPARSAILADLSQLIDVPLAPVNWLWPSAMEIMVPVIANDTSGT